MKYIVETFIEAEVTAADRSKTCHASMGGAMGIDVKDGNPAPFEAARQSILAHGRHGWLELFLKETAKWNESEIQGATATFDVRAKVGIRKTQEIQPVGEFEFTDQVNVGTYGRG